MTKEQLSLFDQNFEENKNLKEKNNEEVRDYMKTADGVVFCSENDFLEESLEEQILYYDDESPRFIALDPERDINDELYIALLSGNDFTMKEVKEKYPERLIVAQRVKSDEIADPADNIFALEKIKNSMDIKKFIGNKKKTSDSVIDAELKEIHTLEAENISEDYQAKRKKNKLS